MNQVIKRLLLLLMVSVAVPVFGQTMSVQDGNVLDLYFQSMDRNRLDSAEIYLKAALKSNPAADVDVHSYLLFPSPQRASFKAFK